MSERVEDYPPVNPPPTRPRRMMARFDVPLNLSTGERIIVSHPVPLTPADIGLLKRYLDTVVTP